MNDLKILSVLNVDFKVKSHVGGTREACWHLLPRFQGNPTHRTWAQLLVQALANASIHLPLKGKGLCSHRKG